MKPECLAQKTAAILPFLCCPLCGEAFSLCNERSLLCAQNHCFDLSRKGYVNLAPHQPQQNEKYNGTLFVSRRRILEGGFYTPVWEAMKELIEAYLPRRPQEALPLLDAGCGEGYYAQRLAQAFPSAQVLGVDLSRDAVVACAQRSPVPHWLVANLSRLPLKAHSLSALINVLTPADYREFARVLSPDGVLLKVIPGEFYLAEVRNAVSASLQSSEYTNADVLTHLRAHAHILGHRSLRYTKPVTPAQAADFVRMTPMTFGLPPEALGAVIFDQITIHLEVLCCQPNDRKDSAR